MTRLDRLTAAFYGIVLAGGIISMLGLWKGFEILVDLAHWIGGAG